MVTDCEEVKLNCMYIATGRNEISHRAYFVALLLSSCTIFSSRSLHTREKVCWWDHHLAVSLSLCVPSVFKPEYIPSRNLILTLLPLEDPDCLLF